METLGGNPICAPGKGNDAGDIEADFNKWSSNVLSFINKIANPNGNDDSLLAWNVSEDGDGYASKRTIRKARKAKLKAEGKLGKKRLPPVAEYAELSDVSSSNIAWNAPSNSKIGGYQATTTSDTQSEYESSIAGDDSSVAGSEYSAANGSVMMNEDEMEEEDRINLQFVTMDNIEDNAGSGQCCNSHSDKGSCSHHHEVKPIVAPIEGDESDEDEPTDSGSAEAKVSSVLDLEDIGSAMDQAKKSQLKEAMSETKNSAEMVTKLQRKALAKEGYRIIGTHSAVKLCRWTKHQMRGRGGCYKHTFYGITSYQCMEATPSLACANKCVFCWRHHKNPVGTEWRWKEDAPDMIVEEAILQHQSMINQMKGVPGVLPERWKEAFTVRHCALSLVGEPIMYPRINEMLKELHDRQISTFLVTNAQFPERIKQLDPVTQLYVSVDAASKDSMKAIDRPLFKDFWERFLQSLYEMRSKQQRTVYRMTLVNDWNMEEVEGYVQLIESGQPGKESVR